MKICMALVFALSSCAAIALAEKGKHRHHKAHVHGNGKLQIAFDGNKGQLQFDAAGMGVLGFEHQAKSEKDQKKLADTIALFESDISKWVKFEPALDCKFAKIEIGQKVEESQKEKGHLEHSDFFAKFSIECAKPLAGTKVSFDFGVFKKLKDLDITVLVGDKQKSAEFKGKPVELDI